MTDQPPPEVLTMTSDDLYRAIGLWLAERGHAPGVHYVADLHFADSDTPGELAFGSIVVTVQPGGAP